MPKGYLLNAGGTRVYSKCLQLPVVISVHHEYICYTVHKNENCSYFFIIPQQQGNESIRVLLFERQVIGHVSLHPAIQDYWVWTFLWYFDICFLKGHRNPNRTKIVVSTDDLNKLSSNRYWIHPSKDALEKIIGCASKFSF